RRRVVTVPHECYYCKEKKVPTYAEVQVLQRFTLNRGKIMSRTRSGICAKHQRRLTSAIKYARHLALLPFVGSD
ncbi:30S ribosomal protein S18, partial [Patescibacteria group bacterium]|nr:30S ribosomal protein S18 [Patescibacteria group bacterium]